MTYQHQLDRAEATLGRIAATVERTEHLLAAVLDTLVAMRPETTPKRTPTVPGAHMRAAFPLVSNPQDAPADVSFASLQGMVPADDPRSSIGSPLGSARYRFNVPTMGALPPGPQTWTPAPGKTGPAWCYPNPALTPGKANPLVTQETIVTTIAVPNWTSTVRPPVSVTSVIKAHIMARDGLTGDPSQWELDHWWPICAGGAVCDIANFWCMPYSPYPGAREKDHVEVWLKEQIVAGKMTLEAAHQALNDDWYATFLSIRRLGLIPMLAAYDPDGSSDPDDNA